REDDVGLERHYLLRQLWKAIVFVSRKSQLDIDVAAFQPAVPFESLLKCRNSLLPFSAGLQVMHQDANAPHPVGLLRLRRQRPRRRTAEQRDELAALHSITSSAMESTLGRTSMPSVLAV